MTRMQRSKGARIEREIVTLHTSAGIPAEKVSRSGYTGPDLQVTNEFRAEVKACKSSEGFATLEKWLGAADLLFLRRDRQRPMVCMAWPVYEQLMRTYTALDGARLVQE